MKRIFVFLVAISLIACSDLKKGSYLQDIAVLEQMVDKTAASWSEMNSTEIDSFLVMTAKQLDTIETLYHGQTIGKEQAIVLDKFKMAHLNFKELIRIQNYFPAILAEKFTALKQLKSDIENASGKREKYGEYIAFEKKEVASIDEQFKNYVALKEKSILLYESSVNEVNEFIIFLQSAN